MSYSNLGRSLSAVVVAAALAAACVPQRDYSTAQIDAAKSLDEVMDVQSTVADPQMSKAGKDFSDADFAGFADAGARIQATSRRIKAFSKGPEFDGFADQLHAVAEKLSAAAAQKDTNRASAALVEMKATCKACHSKFK